MSCGCSKDGKDKLFTISGPYGPRQVVSCCQSCAEGKPCESHKKPVFSLRPPAATVYAFGYDSSDLLVLEDNGGGRLGQRPSFVIDTPAGPLELPIYRIASENGFAVYIPGGCGALTTWEFVYEESFEGNPIPGSELQLRHPIPGGGEVPLFECPPGVYPLFGGGFGRRGPSQPGGTPFDFIGDAVGWLRTQIAGVGGAPGGPGAGLVFSEPGQYREGPEAPPFAPILVPAPAAPAPAAPAPPPIPPAFVPRLAPRRLDVELPEAWRRRPDKGPPLIPLPWVASPAPVVPPEPKRPGVLPLVGLIAWSFLQ